MEQDELAQLTCAGCGKPFVEVGVVVTSANIIEDTYSGEELDLVYSSNKGNLESFDVLHACNGCHTPLCTETIERLEDEGYF